MLLAEANQWPADVRPYFGDGDECHMAFHFPLMPRMFMAVRQEDRHPIVEILRQTPDIPENCQWAMFLRNHDELTLEMVTDEERDYMYQAYAADPQMRINVGIRRRLAPLMENSRRRIELLNSLLMSMPGTPVLYYGDEIGMGDNIYLGDRNGVRTPMQWTGDRNAGFSRADPARLFAPPIMDPVYGYQGINVEAQERSPFSLLNWMKRLIGLRKQFRVFGRGSIEFLPAQNRKVLAYVRRHEEETILCVANLSRSVQPIELDLSRFKGLTPVELLGLTEFPRIGDLPYFLTLGGYAFYWFRLQQAAAPISARVTPGEPVEVTEAPALFMGVAWDTLLEGNVRTLIERDLLMGFLQRQRWFGAKARPMRSARFVDWGVLRRAPQPLFLTIVEVEFADGGRDRYFLPLAICSHGETQGLRERAGHAILANIAGARKAVLFDGWLDDGFARALLEVIEKQEQNRTRRGNTRALQTGRFAAIRGADDLPPRRVTAEQSNTSLIFGDRLFLKLFRRLDSGINPDFEIGRYLTEQAGFTRVPAVLGALEDATIGEVVPSTLAMLQELVDSQADGWAHATDEVRRFYEAVHSRPAPDAVFPLLRLHGVDGASAAADDPRPGRGIPGDGGAARPPHRGNARGARLGRQQPGLRTRALHPRRSGRDHHRSDRGGATRLRLARGATVTGPDLLARRQEVLDRLHRYPALEFAASKIRVHGDYHLGQVLLAEGDFYILDFEGEPVKPLLQRRDEAVAAQGRRRHDALLQLRGACRAVRLHRRTARHLRSAHPLGPGLGHLGDRRVPARILRSR